jgi:aspartate/glutamate racemase
MLVYIIGGLGTLSGLDIIKKMVNYYNTIHNCTYDYEQIKFFLDSVPLEEHFDHDSCKKSLNQAVNRVKSFHKIVKDKIILGIGCNTMHDTIRIENVKFDSNFNFVNIINETASKVNNIKGNKKIYLLSSIYTFKNRLYSKNGLQIEDFSDDMLVIIEDIIKNVKKMELNNDILIKNVFDNIDDNSIVILGCTDLPVIIDSFKRISKEKNIEIVDCNFELACKIVKLYKHN